MKLFRFGDSHKKKLWTALRSRPFSKVADPKTTPHSVFVTAMDTNPLSPLVAEIIEGKEKHFANGLTVLSRLTRVKVSLSKALGDPIPQAQLESLSVVEFSDPHRAGNVGTHFHFLDPVNRHRQVWYINAQDVISMGLLLTAGKLLIERVILTGSSGKNQRLIKTRIGASVADVTSGELNQLILMIHLQIGYKFLQRDKMMMRDSNGSRNWQ